MPPTWLTILAWVSLALAFATVAVIVYDIYGRGYRQKMTVMEAVWPVTAFTSDRWHSGATNAGDA